MNKLSFSLGWPAAVVGVMLLAGCVGSNGQNFVAGDVNLAATVANTPAVPAVAANPNAVDPSGYACWGSLAPGIAAISAGQTVGFATMIEVARVGIIMARTKGPCAALAAPILSQLALLPGAGNALAIAATSVQ